MAFPLARARNSPDRSTKSTRSRLSHIALPPVVDTGFQVLFHSPPGLLFTFPSRYFALSVTREYLSLGGWSPRLPTGFHVSCGTPDPAHLLSFPRTGLSPSPVGLSSTLPFLLRTFTAVLTPHPPKEMRFGLLRFRSPLLAGSHRTFRFFLISFPPPT